jgi:hypothetical protein
VRVKSAARSTTRTNARFTRERDLSTRMHSRASIKIEVRQAITLQLALKMRVLRKCPGTAIACFTRSIIMKKAQVSPNKSIN